MAAALSLLLGTAAFAQRTEMKPGWNIFSVEQDVEIGRQTSAEAEKQLPLLGDRKVDEYLNRLGRQLADKAPGAKYPYQFKAVNDTSINAFALPGGFLYINRGTIEAAENEAQLAGVVGHEIAHVALRHGTNQATKAYIAQAPLAVLGGLVGSGSVKGILAQIGAGFAANSVLLKYSREAERQADLMGTQILFDNGFDPRAMAQFFEKLQGEGKSRAPEFFSSHPHPENRTEGILEEIEKMGGYHRSMRNDSVEFQEIQRHIRSLPQPKAAPTGQPSASAGRTSGAPQPASRRLQSYENRMIRIRHPENWRVQSDANSATIAPEGGIIAAGKGNVLAWGMMAGVFEPKYDRWGRVALEDATEQLLEGMAKNNPQLRAAGRQSRVEVAGEQGLSLLLSNASPAGGRETAWLVTVLRREGLHYFIGVSPEADFENYRRTFETMLDSIRFVRR